MSDFFQDGPQLENSFLQDPVLADYLRYFLGEDCLQAVTPDLTRLGARAAMEMPAIAEAAESQPPRHVPYDAWGRRIDQIETSEAWQTMKRIAAEEGITATAYERRFGDHSRVVQAAQLFLYHPASAIFSCPLAMTDGAARAIELYGDAYLKEEVFPHLVSRDPALFWTSGQWMTERSGGSDVSGTSTIAQPSENGFRLFGTKWFTSATTSEMAMTLARIEGAEPGSRGLSLFFLKLKNEDGGLNHIFVHRLKDKLGTKALPTAELSLQGSKAILVGEPGNGVRKISSLFNITRVYNSVCAVGGMQRAWMLAVDYANRRRAFGKTLIEHPLHRTTLGEMALRARASIMLTFYVASLLGKDECDSANADEKAVLRLLTPVTKLFTAKEGIAVTSEALECFGGAGYVEDTGLPRMLRDAQVLSIWEGTTNILSLDTLRAIAKEEAFSPWAKDMARRLSTLKSESLAEAAGAARCALNTWIEYGHRCAELDRTQVESQARAFAMGIGRITAAILLLAQAQGALFGGDERKHILTARAFCRTLPQSAPDQQPTLGELC